MSTVVIELDGVDITAMVKIATASFGSAVNGVGGTCSFEIRDLDHVFGPIVGKKLTVTIDGALKWAGYALSAARQYGFAIDDTSRPEKTERLFLMQGVDNNVLFQKRVVWNKDHPTHGELPAPVGHRCASPRVGEWAEDTRTDVIIPYLIENYTSMFGDGVTMDVDDFGSPMPDDCGAVSGGVTVGDMMADLNRSLNGVFYLMPDYTFRYHAADTVTTDWILTDKPSGDHDIGPRSYSFLSDGSRMVNDALVWATALGWDTVTFSRAQDDDDSGQVSSITDHGRWQYGEFNTQMHRQATVDERAHTIVYGLDSSQQGARWDQIVVEATTSRSVFNLGDVVTCRAESYTGTLREPFNAPDGNGVGTDVLEIALPIRRMQITFLSPTEPRFTMVLTRELDDPFSAFESRFPPLRTPRGTRPPVIDFPGPFPGPPDPGPGTCDCGITDTFTRDIAPNPDSWGMSDMGATWRRASFGDDGIFSVDGSAGTIDAGPGSERTQRLDLPAEAAPDKDIYVDVKFTGAAGATDGQDIWDIWYGGGYISDGEVVFDYYPAGYSGYAPFGIIQDMPVFSFWFGYENTFDVFETTFARELADDTWYTIHINLDHTHKVTSVRIWPQSEAEPNTWDTYIDFSASDGSWDPMSSGENIIGISAGVDGQTLTIDNLDVSGNTRCDATQFDNFERTVTNGWGNATPSGVPWLVGTADGVSDPTALASAFSVHDGYGEFLFASTPSDDGVIRIEGIPTTPIEMLVKFSANGTDGSANPQFYVSAYDTNVWYYHGIDVGMFSGSSYISPVSYGTDQPGDVTSLDLPDMTDWNTIWMLRMSVEGGRVMGKVWRSTETEPVDWQVMAGQTDYAFPTDHGEINNFYLFFPNIDSDIRIYDLEFNYEGKPCYYDCGGVTDSFDRADTVDGLGTSDSGQSWDNGGFINGGTAEAPAGLGVSPTSAPPVLSVSSSVPFSTSIIRTEPADPGIDGSGPAYSGRIVLHMDDNGTIALSWREEPTWVLTLIRLDVVGEGGGGADETFYADTFDVTFPFTLEVCYADGVAMASIDGHNLSFDYAANGVTLPNGLVGYQLGWID